MKIVKQIRISLVLHQQLRPPNHVFESRQTILKRSAVEKLLLLGRGGEVVDAVLGQHIFLGSSPAIQHDNIAWALAVLWLSESLVHPVLRMLQRKKTSQKRRSDAFRMAKSATGEDDSFVFKGLRSLRGGVDGMWLFFGAIEIRAHYTIDVLWEFIVIPFSFDRIIRHR